MDIKILKLIEGAQAAQGLTVIIDVFRAFTTACYAFAGGADRIIPVGDIDVAYQLKEAHPEYILMGERGGKMQPGFDYGNSPSIIAKEELTGKTLIHTTSAGTQGIVNATGANEIISGSFVNAGAIVRYIQQKQPGQVSLVAMGKGGLEESDEDMLCAAYLKNAIENRDNYFEKIVDHLRKYKSARKFFDPDITWAPEQDFEHCMALNRFEFVLKTYPLADGLVYFRKIPA
ncbi:MAG: 2-phosphosulfolactate phosphatase [candidate division KSB1 bacterium]|jgi:2-phosphosulfolactate phosphatase|nr:2-phosphosulfolactate phosphatase [candidate division KSB1 bacterium]